MADKKISELTELTTPDGTEELVVNDSGVSKKVQIDNLIADNGLSGDKIDGGTISNFTSTGIDDNATSTAITIDASENVGIGTATPSDALNLVSTNSTIRLDYNGAVGTKDSLLGKISFGAKDGSNPTYDASTTSSIRAGNDAAGNWDGGIGRYDTNLTFHTSADSVESERMRIDSAGKVGINTTSPAEKLEVVGNVKGTSFYTIRGILNLNSGSTATLAIPHGVYYLSLRHTVSGSTQHLASYVTASWWHSSASYWDVYQTGGDTQITASVGSYPAASGTMNLAIYNGSANSGHNINYSLIKVN